MKEAIWITCGPRGNAGDALLYDVTKALFRDKGVNLRFRYVSERPYLRPGDEDVENVMIGPGGMFVQTNSSKHLHQGLSAQWDQFEHKRFFLWSTGILSNPTEAEVPLVQRVTERADRIIVRAGKESEFFRNVADVESEWAPCASLFADRLMGVPKNVEDVVVLNLDDYMFTAENIADHPMRRFKQFAEAQGLDVRLMVNARGDSNEYLRDLFPVIEADAPLMEGIWDGKPTPRTLADRMLRRTPPDRTINGAISAMPSYAARYTNARFAFGKRLHGWLPFMAFDQPAAFMGMRARWGMPEEYFGTAHFFGGVTRRPGMSRDQVEAVAERMIRKLNFFIHSESWLVPQIAETRERLWQQLDRQADEFVSAMH